MIQPLCPLTFFTCLSILNTLFNLQSRRSLMHCPCVGIIYLICFWYCSVTANPVSNEFESVPPKSVCPRDWTPKYDSTKLTKKDSMGGVRKQQCRLKKKWQQKEYLCSEWRSESLNYLDTIRNKDLENNLHTICWVKEKGELSEPHTWWACVNRW